MKRGTEPPDPLDAVALIKAHIRGDKEAIDVLLDTVDAEMLCATTVGMMFGLLHAGGFTLEDIEEALDRWRDQHLQGMA